MSYVIRYEVDASTRLEAIDKAASLLRIGVRLNGVHQVEEFLPGWWVVLLNVWEDA